MQFAISRQRGANMGIAHEAAKFGGYAVGHVHAGVDKLVSRRLTETMAPRICVTSTAFAHDGPLPVSSTVDGEGTPPVLEWNDVPAEAQSLAVVCEDPDAPLPEPFVHWLVYAIPPSARSLDSRTLAEAKEGQNSRMSIGFAPAAPTPGHGLHHYHFQVFALDTPTSFLDAGVGRSALVEAIDGHVLAWGEVAGTYDRT
jgi:Raf kinase inhibitor-like YbhB/YbcL family protein